MFQNKITDQFGAYVGWIFAHAGNRRICDIYDGCRPIFRR